jgi:hypothetical protein
MLGAGVRAALMQLQAAALLMLSLIPTACTVTATVPPLANSWLFCHVVRAKQPNDDMGACTHATLATDMTHGQDVVIGHVA